jgi:mRNA-degrading endonuclease RelE of RelBE toxin-antitoxin system
MGYSIKTISVFEKQARRLSRKYPSLKKDLLELVLLLKENPETGTSLGNNCYKIRMAISSKSKGKSGGARIITHIVVADQFVYLLSIYDKSEKTDLTDGELKQLLKGIIQ